MPKTSPIFDTFFWIATHVFPIPVGILLAPIFKIYNFISFSPLFGGRTSKEIHTRKVKQVQNQVKEWNLAGRKSRMCTGRSAWRTFSIHNMDKSKLTKINIDLNDIVEIDKENQMLTVEPGVAAGKLTWILEQEGWTIGVVPELETLTIGGVICGTGIQSGSGKFGLIGDSCHSFEVVLANGDVVNCSREENSDLFYSIPWSHGTIGFLTAIRIPLIRATRYARVEYVVANTIGEAKNLLSMTGNDFMEAIAFGIDKFVVIIGNLSDAAEPGKVNHINHWYKPWFYKHAETFLSKDASEGPFIEYIPLRDYYHRYTRSYFFQAQYLIPNGNNVVIRYLFGFIYPLNFQVCKLVAHKFMHLVEGFFPNQVVEDFMLPLEKLETCLNFFHETLQVYPLWICPCKFPIRPGMVQPAGNEDEVYVDFGIFGIVPKEKQAEYSIPITGDKMEQFAIRQHGFQFLYSNSYLSREDFCRMFNMELYDKVREKYQCADAFPHVYDKISKDARRLNYEVKV